MRLCICFVLFASLAAVAGERKIVNLSDISKPVAVEAENSRARTVMVRGTASPRTTEIVIGNKFAQAPGLVQIDIFGDIYNNGMTVWFLATSLIPKETLMFPYMIVEETDGNMVATRFEGRKLEEDIQAGYSFFLPSFHRFSSFWPSGKVLTYGVKVVNLASEESLSIDEFPVKGGWNATGLATLTPLVKQSRLSWVNNKPIMTLEGVFRDPVPLISLDDYVVPAEAIVSASRNEVVVNLSKVGIDQTILQSFLLTVGQEGFANSSVFRFCPQF